VHVIGVFVTGESFFGASLRCCVSASPRHVLLT
jgi:hypothetical protein